MSPVYGMYVCMNNQWTINKNGPRCYAKSHAYQHNHHGFLWQLSACTNSRCTFLPTVPLIFAVMEITCIDDYQELLSSYARSTKQWTWTSHLKFIVLCYVRAQQFLIVIHRRSNEPIYKHMHWYTYHADTESFDIWQMVSNSSSHIQLFGLVFFCSTLIQFSHSQSALESAIVLLCLFLHARLLACCCMTI